MSSRTRRALRLGALGVLAIALLAFARRLDWVAVGATLRGADMTLLSAAVLINLLSLVLRGMQWWIFLRPLGATSLSLALRGAFVGSALNAVVAAHAGEGARVVLVARAAGVPSAGVLAAVGLERVLDGACYLALLTGAAWLLPLPEDLRRWRVVAAFLLAGLAALIVGLGIAARNRSVSRAIHRERLTRRLLSHLRHLGSTLISLGSFRRLAIALPLSLAAWALQVGTYHLVARAAGLPLPLPGSVAALLAVGVSFLVRATPGNVGVFQVVYALAVGMFGVEQGPAVAVALLLQASQTVPTLLVAALLAPGLFRHASRARSARPVVAPLLLAQAVASPLPAQQPDTGAVIDAGHGSEPFVLIAGMVGGVAGYRRLAEELLARGERVVIVDPYRLSIDSADATFAAMARRVDAVLARRGVTRARIVGHAHGAGVALRLAVHAPGRVSALYFLDAGALASNGTAGFARAMRIAQVIAHLPGGAMLIRRRFLAGMRENAVRHDWLDSAMVRDYVVPVLDHLDHIVPFAMRLARAREPAPLSVVLSQVRAPVLVILPGVPTPSGAGVEELLAVRELGALVSYARVEGVGHFIHEEAPAEVAHLLLGSGAAVATAARPPSAAVSCSRPRAAASCR